MILFPAIDIKNGQVVRLKKGDFTTAEAYNNNPLTIAKQFYQDGASWLHIIDLDRTETGTKNNQKTIESIVKNVPINIQVGGGIRSTELIESYLALGVTRVIVSTFALLNLDQLKPLIKKYPGKIVVSLDANNGFVTTHGWQNTLDKPLVTVAQELESVGIDTVVITDISKDGMMAGTNITLLREVMTKTNLNVIASGGVHDLNEITILNNLNVYGAIVGKALYVNAFTLKEALSCLQNASSPA
ncbi:MAG: 1-(5-phosphoribosyl)-5-[(5-phosphoribosylamino)methylideneamino]imidazole-4-carboxamide isomerase [Bacillota bacterium]